MDVSSLNGPDPTMREHSLTSCTVLHFWVEPVLGLAGDDDADTVRVGALEGAGALVAVPPAGAREGDADADTDGDEDGDGDGDWDGDGDGDWDGDWDEEGDGTSAVVVGAGSVLGRLAAATSVGEGFAGASCSALKPTADRVTAKDTTTIRC